MNKKSVIWLVFFGLLIVGLSSLLVYRLFFFEKLHNATKVVKVVDRISDYDYKLEDRDSKLYKTYFNELKELLSKNNVDEEKYADLLTKLFIIDFYTLDNFKNAVEEKLKNRSVITIKMIARALATKESPKKLNSNNDLMKDFIKNVK